MSSSISSECGCAGCPNGIAPQYVLTVSGITNGPQCNTCISLNGNPVLPTQVLLFPECLAMANAPGCSFSWSLVFAMQPSGLIKATLTLTGPAFTWSAIIADCMQPFTVGGGGSDLHCNNYPGSIPVAPVPLTLAQLNSPVPCLSNLHSVCMLPGLAAANLGAPLLCCYPPDPQACQNQDPCGCGTPVQAKQGRPIPGCSGFTLIPSCPVGSTVAGVNTAPTGGNACGCGCSGGKKCSGGGCGCGGGGGAKAIYSGGILAETQDRVARLQAMITPSIPGLSHGPGHVNILNGIMALQIVLPDAGPYSPDPFLTYCSKTALQTEYGYGWQGAHKRQLVVIDSATAQITDSAGSNYRFFNKSSAGLYVPAAGITNSLVENSDGSFTETQPDGFSYRYSSGGQLARMQTLASQRYTLAYDGGGRVIKVLDPFSRRLTYSYDGSSHIRHIIDVGGRITTFSVDGSGNLASHTAPDGAQTNFRYDGAHKLIAHITPTTANTS